MPERTSSRAEDAADSYAASATEEPVLITGGDLLRREQGCFMVPKRDLVAGLVVRVERGQLKIAKGLKGGEAGGGGGRLN